MTLSAYSTVPQSAPKPHGHFRWVICALLLFATTINYMDRFVLGLVFPILRNDFGWNESDYANILFCFEIAYAIGLVCFGRILDWVGTRKGFTSAVVVWSLAAIGQAFMTTVAGFGSMMFMLGLGESGVFPAAVKTTAEWFPKAERALVAGIFNAGSNVGAITAPILVPWLCGKYGWPWAFIVVGSFGFLWVFLWLLFYQIPAKSKHLKPAELAHIEKDPPQLITQKIPWIKLLGLRQTWAFIVAKFMTDAVWRWYFYFMPLFLVDIYGMNIKEFAWPLVVIYVVADMGSVTGGGLSSWFLRQGWSTNAARKTAMLICSIAVVPVAFSTTFHNQWLAVALVAMAAAAHQGFSSNIFTTVSDMFPKSAVASVVGLGGTAGCVGAMLLLYITKTLFEHLSPNADKLPVYTVLFVIAGATYLISLLFVQLISPKLKPVTQDQLA